MAFTRFHDDPNRIKKQIMESSFTGRYMLNTPGQGTNLPFFEDPHIRLQYWGANLRNDTVNLESDLRGMTRPLNRDNQEINNYKKQSNEPHQVSYQNAEPFVQESRASHPAWMYKDLEQTRWEAPFLNPSNGLEKEFEHNLQTRILEKDNFIRKMPVVDGTENLEYYLGSRSVCIGGNEESCPGTLYSNRIH
jgi:hypothetical protein